MFSPNTFIVLQYPYLAQITQHAPWVYLVDTVLVQARLPRRLVEKLDELVELGLFSSRSEVVAEAVRRLILEYGRVVEEDVVFIEKYLSGEKPAPTTSSVAEEVDLEEAMRKVRGFLGSNRVEDAITYIRGKRR